MHESTERHPTIPLARLLAPVGRCLTPTTARNLVDLHADQVMQQRLEELAERNTEDTLTEEERGEYETLVHAIDFIAVLQAQARHLLSTKTPAGSPG